MASGPYVLDFVEGDLLPNVVVQLEGEDITDFDIKLHVRKPNGTKITKTAVIDEANVDNLVGVAEFHFEWAAGDLVAGESKAEIELFDAASNNETFPGLILRVAEEIA
jgi:TATA-box binding protein (TBP) (component of TFIID and TFIIIB)